MMKQIYLKRGKEESLQRFHPWVFSGAIQHADPGIEEGEIVRVMKNNGDFIATGHSMYPLTISSGLLVWLRP